MRKPINKEKLLLFFGVLASLYLFLTEETSPDYIVTAITFLLMMQIVNLKENLKRIEEKIKRRNR